MLLLPVKSTWKSRPDRNSRRPHRRVGSRAWLSGLLLAGGAMWATTLSLGQQPAPDDQPPAELLVQQLGDSEFAMRERATARLVELGMEALSALQHGARSNSREVRERSERILQVVVELDLQHRLDDFERGADPERDYGLPGWKAYRSLVGDGQPARSLFVAMQREEAKLLRHLDASAESLNHALSQYCDAVLRQQQNQTGQLNLGSAASLLLLANDERVELSPVVRYTVYQACMEITFRSAVQSQSVREPVIRLLGGWIGRDARLPARYVLEPGLVCEVPASAVRARAVLELPTTPVDYLFAALCLARFGNEADLPRLEKLLDDPAICLNSKVGERIVATQVRDVALVSLLQLAKQDPAAFGFDRLQRTREYGFDLSSLGFFTDEQRAAAIAKWRDFRAKTP